MNIITVQYYKTRLEADIAKGKLEAFGIRSLVVADDAGGMRPFPLQYTYGVELKVLEKDLAEAKDLLGIE